MNFVTYIDVAGFLLCVFVVLYLWLKRDLR